MFLSNNSYFSGQEVFDKRKQKSKYMISCFIKGQKKEKSKYRVSCLIKGHVIYANTGDFKKVTLNI